MSANDNTISVRVLFFGAARDAAGLAEADLRLSSPSRAAGAFEKLLASYPELRRFGGSLLFAVNQEYAQPDLKIADGDELRVIHEFWKNQATPTSSFNEPTRNFHAR